MADLIQALEEIKQLEAKTPLDHWEFLKFFLARRDDLAHLRLHVGAVAREYPWIDLSRLKAALDAS